MSSARAEDTGLLSRSERGATLIFFALFSLLIFFFIALGVDGGLLTYRHAQLRAALDAATIRAADALYQGKSKSDSEALARSFLAANLDANGLGGTIASGVATGATAEFNADESEVRLSAALPQSFFFAHLIPGSARSREVVGSSSAAVVDDQLGELSAQHYIFVLDNSNSMANTMKNNTAVEYTNPDGELKSSKKKKAGLYVALRKFITESDGDWIGITLFGGGGCSVLFEPIPILDELTGFTDENGTAITNREYALQKIWQVMTTHSGTPIACGMDRAFLMLEGLLGSTDVDVSHFKVVLMTDGIPTTKTLSGSSRDDDLRDQVEGWCTLTQKQTWVIQIADLIKTFFGASVHTINYIGLEDNPSNRAQAVPFLHRVASDAASRSYPNVPCTNTPKRFLSNPASPEGTYNEAQGADTLTNAFENIAASVVTKRGGVKYTHPEDFTAD